MRFLSIVWYKVLPAYFGGQKGIALFNHYLSVDAPLDCLCSKNNESSINLPYNTIPALPNSKTQFLNPFCWKTIIATARKQKSTHLILEHPYYGIAGFLAKKILKIKLIVHSHNIEYLRFKELKKWWWPFLQWYEGWTYQQADLNIFKTTSDCNRAIHQFRLQQNKCVIIPYGTGGSFPFDEKTQARKEMEKLHGINADEKILLFAGTLDYLPNAEAVKAIYTIIAPELVKKGLLFKIFI